MSNYAMVNESIRFLTTTDASIETRSALAAFFRRNGFPQVYAETLAPLLTRAELVLSVAVTERPWPPKGIGSQSIDAVGMAMMGSEGRAFLTPVLLDRKHATNIGLAGAVTKGLLEELGKRKASTAGYLVRQGDRALERVLEQTGFGRSDLHVATESADYVEYAAPPMKVLEGLGLGDARLGDLLALNLDGQQLDRLGAYHFSLAAGIAPYLLDELIFAPLLPGFIDVVATLPPGGVPPGTPGPQFPLPGEIRR